MSIKVNPTTSISFLDTDFVQLLNQLLQDASLDYSDGVILNFRAPAYSAENGGYHPVEIAIDPEGVKLHLKLSLNLHRKLNHYILLKALLYHRPT